MLHGPDALPYFIKGVPSWKIQLIVQSQLWESVQCCLRLQTSAAFWENIKTGRNCISEVSRRPLEPGVLL